MLSWSRNNGGANITGKWKRLIYKSPGVSRSISINVIYSYILIMYCDA